MSTSRSNLVRLVIATSALLMGCPPGEVSELDGGRDAAVALVDGGAEVDAGAIGDAGEVDAGISDAGDADAGNADAGELDAGSVDAGPGDAGALDAGSGDAGADAGRIDAGLDAGRIDAGLDAGRTDAGIDAGRIDAGVDAGCVTAARGFFDFGVGAPVAEGRGAIPMETSLGQSLVIAAANDVGTRPFIMVTNVDTGVSRQVYFPTNVPQRAPFGSMVSSAGKYYTAQGAIFTEFDPITNAFTFQQNTIDGGSVDYLGYTEGLDGTIWAGGVYETRLISFNPITKVITTHGRMDDSEEYLYTLATDDQGWVYAGIGTNLWNIVAYNPTTRERRNLIPSGSRQLGTASVYPASNGRAVGTAGSTTYLLYNGAASVIAAASAPARREVRAISWGATSGTFPDGRKLRTYDMPSRSLEVTAADGGASVVFNFNYTTEGADLTSLGNGGNADLVYASSAHPMHFLQIDACRRTMTDLGYMPGISSGNMPAISHQGRTTFGASYSTGGLWTYDDRVPFDADGANASFRVTQGLTIEAWINVQAPTETYGIIGARGINTYFFAVQQNGRVALVIGDNLSNTVIARGGTVVTGAWNHVAGTYDSQTGIARVYVNGVLDGTATGTPGPIGNKAGGFGIGSSISYNIDAYHLNGLIDELRIYYSPLSATELTNHRNGTFNASGLKALWHFDESSGLFAADSTANGNELRLVGNIQWVPGRVGGALDLDGVTSEGITDKTNPLLVANESIDIARPRAVFAHPDGVTIGFSGYAGYGRCGGGIGLYNLMTRQKQLLTADTELLSGHSPISLTTLPNGNVVGGTAVDCPGGGVVTQTEAEIFVLDWATKRATFRMKPVAGQAAVRALATAPSGMVYGLTSNNTFFVFNPTTQTIIYSLRWTSYGNVPMHAIQRAPTGEMYVLMGSAILQINPTTYAATKLADAPVTIEAGGGISRGSLFFSNGSHLWSYTL